MQFKRELMSCLRIEGGGPMPSPCLRNGSTVCVRIKTTKRSEHDAYRHCHVKGHAHEVYDILSLSLSPFSRLL